MRIFVIEKKVARHYERESPDHENSSSDNHQNDLEAENGETQPLLGNVDNESDFKLSEDQPKLFQVIPILPCLTNSSLVLAIGLALVQAILIGSLDGTIATQSKELFDFDSLKAGLLFLPLGFCDLIFGPIAGWAVDRYGTKIVATITFVLSIPVFVLLRLPHPGGTPQVALYGTLLGLTGISLSGTGAPSIVEAGAIVDKYHKANPKFFGEDGPYAMLYGLNSMMFNLGLTIGPEIAGHLREEIGYGNMNIVMAAICAVTAVLCFVYLGGKPKMLRKKSAPQ